jgi:lysyl-tRNA synthetase class 2
VKFVAMEVNGTLTTGFNGTTIDLSQWRRLSMREAIIEFWDSDICGPKPELRDFTNRAGVLAMLDRTMAHVGNWQQRIERDPHSWQKAGREASGERRKSHFVFGEIRDRLTNTPQAGTAIAEIFETVAEEHLIQPTIIYDFPLAVSPLSKVKPDEPDWVERFEFYIGGFELGNAFSELNDPVDQERRFTQQLAERQRGDEEAHQPDEDYVRALAYGLPPTAGEGIGIDRLTMVLTGARSIRDVILFPLMRPTQEAPSRSDQESQH